MNDCVFHAFLDYLDYIFIDDPYMHVRNRRNILSVYVGLKESVVSLNDMFPACAIPHLMEVMCYQLYLSYWVNYQPPFDKNFWVAHATSREEESRARLGTWHSGKIFNEPGIYLPMHGKHAIFSLAKPDYPVIMSVQLYKKGEQL